MNKVRKEEAIMVKSFENLINDFAIKRLDKAYFVFNQLHDYDPRNYKDSLLYSNWCIDEGLLKLTYVEKTPHDKPYKITLNYNIEYLKLFTQQP